MKSMLALTILLVVVLPAVAFDLDNHLPAKPAGSPTVAPPPDPAVLRQGGDTIADAVRIPIPSVDVTGTTVGYNPNYDEMCPYGGWAPDVVYSILPVSNLALDIDLCGSLYDTKLLVYLEDLTLVACNDDFYGGPPCGLYVSKIENMPVTAGVEYFIVVSGYGSAAGEYLLDVVERVPCGLDCPAGAVLEDEPPLVNDYVDLHNGGCNTDLANPPFQPLTSDVFCGVSGFYLYQGSSYRDTDWFTMEMPETGIIELTGDAEIASYMFELGPQDCDSVGVLQQVQIGPCTEATITITGAPGSTVWFWVGPTTFSLPDGSDVYEFDYVLHTNLGPVKTENRSWTGVKALFD